MKKVFVSLLLAIVFCSPAFAGDWQKQFEVKHRLYDNEDFCKKYVQLMLKDDYETQFM